VKKRIEEPIRKDLVERHESQFPVAMVADREGAGSVNGHRGMSGVVEAIHERQGKSTRSAARGLSSEGGDGAMPRMINSDLLLHI